jgi:hypothetical protein
MEKPLNKAGRPVKVDVNWASDLSPPFQQMPVGHPSLA